MTPEAPSRLAQQDPGTPLLLDEQVLAAPRRAREFSEYTGIEVKDLIISPLVSTPVPIYNFNLDGTGTRRWSGTNPEAMWHPLMWLPSRLAHRYRYKDLAGEEVYESDDQWAARVVMELTAAGLYNPETGAWVDILATAGIDIEDELDLARVEDWLDGEEDEILDEISLHEILLQEDETWALVNFLVLEDVLWQASHALAANSLIELLDMAFFTDSERVMSTARSAASLGLSLLGEVESDAYETPMANVFGDLFIELGSVTHDHQDAVRLVNSVFEALDVVRESCWPALEALHGADDERKEALAGAE